MAGEIQCPHDLQESPRRGEVTVAEPTGADTFVVVKTDAGDVTVRTSPQTQARPGDAAGLEIQAARVSWFDAGIGVRV